MDSTAAQLAAQAVADGGPLVAPADAPAELGALLERAARLHPVHGVGYLDREGALARQQSYPALLEEARRTLTGLRSLGLQPGDPVLFQFGSNEDFIVAFWGCTLAGAIPVPLSLPHHYDESDAAAAKFMHSWRLLDRPLTLASGNRVDELRAFAGGAGLSGLRVAAIDALRRNPAAESRHMCAGDDVALLLLTSGSTGKPKAVRQTHGNLARWAASAAHACGFGPDDVSINWMPLDHVGGIVMSHLRDLGFGGTQYHAPIETVLRNPLIWLDWIDRYRATATWAPNFAFALVNEREADIAHGHWDLSCMRFILNGGEAIVAKTARRFLELLAPHGLRETAMRPAWGMSETCSGVTYSRKFTRAGTSDADSFVSVGEPIPGVRLRAVDANDEPVPEGEVGRLQIQGISVTPGYYQDAEANRNSFTADGWFVTGDLAVIADGEVTIVGREKDVIIINGVNFPCHEIEAAAEEVQGVDVSFTAACAVRPADADTDRLAIFFSPAAGQETALPALVSRLRMAVARKVGVTPDYLVPLPGDEIPKTAIGKIQRSQLKQRFERGEFAEVLTRLRPGQAAAPALFRPVWREAALDVATPPDAANQVLVFADAAGLGTRIAGQLGLAGSHCITVAAGPAFAPTGENAFSIDPAQAADYRRLFGALAQRRFFPTRVVHAWAYDAAAAAPDAAALEAAQALGSLGLLRLLRAWPAEQRDAVRLLVVTSRTQAVTDGEAVEFAKAPLLGIVRTIPHELEWLDCATLDFAAVDPAADAAPAVAELFHAGSGEAAIRAGRRFAPVLEPAEAKATAQPFRRGGLYVLTGATGGIGRLLARHLVEQHDARLLLLGRAGRGAPEENFVAGDIADPAFVRAAIADAVRRHGMTPSGIFHLAGAYHEAPLTEETDAGLLALLRPKLLGAWALHQAASDYDDCACVHFSSLLGTFGALATGAYAAANAALDAFAQYQCAEHVPGRSVAWSLWDGVGMAATANQQALQARGFQPLRADSAFRLLQQALGCDAPVLLAGLDASNRSVRRRLGADAPEPGPGEEYVAPRTPLEARLADLWQQVLGVPRVGVTSNFFDLGGRSLLAARLFARIEKEFSHKLPLATLYQAPTVEGLAALLSGGDEVPAGCQLVPIQPQGSLPPFFCIPGVGSDVIVFQELAGALGPARPFYGLQTSGLDGTPIAGPEPAIEQVAADFVKAIRHLQPNGPYFLGGHCFGSLLAWEVARQLDAAGHEVGVLALIDPVVGNVLPIDLLRSDRLRYSLQKLWRVPPWRIGSALWEKFTNVRRALLVKQRLGRSIRLAQSMHDRYRPGRYRGRVLIFMADDSFFRIAPDRDPRRSFEGLADAGAEYYRVTGNHDSILRAPGAQELGSALRACLAQASARRQPAEPVG